MKKLLTIGLIVGIVLISGCITKEQESENNIITPEEPDDKRIVDSTNVDKDGNKIADNFEVKLKDGTYNHYGTTAQADIIISLNQPPSDDDVQLVQELGGNVYQQWSKLIHAMHASLPPSEIKKYISGNPRVVLIDENSKMSAT